ncbi:hypothetical protein LEP1GSC198_3595 [Leptospira kirschneri str. JB]|uniref:Uncharacterized protein n=1 Tax=Leptospira kirschneri str. H1 TaxID=1049966 RepID=A0A0E2B8P5_9LEPT|nr:hypothetical protein LEP1GSC081_0190 [Leptospira kirschneri str. H1]EMJ85502.1 hypothetical protein LEP1GSC198_3595 [Leptospira kirschneri str. JB]
MAYRFDFIKSIFLKSGTSSLTLDRLWNRNDKLKLYEVKCALLS